MATFSELPIIARCHSYAIRTKFQYKCVKCGYSIGRHSKSLDTSTKVCGYCKGKFELVTSNVGTNIKGTGENDSDNFVTPKRPPNAFSAFVKDNYRSTRTPGITHGETMKKLSEQFAKTKVMHTQ